MKILHTSDIHLDEDSDERWQALRHLVDIGAEEGVDVLAISGDLFDAEAEARTMRNSLREVFSGAGFDTVLIPGNHDAAAFQQGLDFGERVTVMSDPHRPLEYDDAVVWGLPFAEDSGEETLEKLRSMAPAMEDEDRANVLLFHGELLDAFYGGRDFGDEEGRYMPVKLAYFRDVPVDYVLAGHFHGSWDLRQLQNDADGFFVYPGSPVSVTRSETGPRKANLFEVGDPPEERVLQTRYYADVDVELDPLDDQQDPVREVKRKLNELPPQAAPVLTVRGYVNAQALGRTESEIIDELRELAADRCVDARFPLTDASVVLQDELFQRFRQRMADMDCPEDRKERMQELMIRAMTEARS